MDVNMTLYNAPTGQALFVLAVEAEEPERKRIEGLGIFPGGEVRVLAAGAGPVLLAVGETRVAIERDLAAKVFVA